LPSSLVPYQAGRSGDDPIFALHGEAVRRAAAGEDVLNATLGALLEDDGRPALLPSVAEAYTRIAPEASAVYAPIAGPPRFLSAVTLDLLGGTPLAEQAVAVATPGGTGAVHHAIVNFLEPGESLLTTSYYWGPYGILADHTRRGLATFPMFTAEGTLDLDALESALRAQAGRQRRLLLVLNTPCHNPTGYSLDEGEWRRVADILLEVGGRTPTTLLVDLAYAKFREPGRPAWPAQVARLAGRVTVLLAWTASKAFAQYGARVGALVAVHPDPEERRRIRNALGYSCRGTWSNCNHLGMLAVAELFEDPDLRARSERERERLRRLLDERVEAFKALALQAGLAFPRYEGGFFVAVFTPDAERTAAAMRERGVFVVPLEGAVRIGLCATPRVQVPRLVEALAAGVAAAGGVPSAL
jgi:aromatic-amino-acid transaminase